MEKGSLAKIKRWLHPLVFAPEGEAPNKVELRHVSVGDKATVVRSWDLSGADEERIKSIADQADQAATDDADGVGGVQRYALAASNSGGPCGRLVLRYRSDAEAEGRELGEFGDSEPANAKGLLAATMRHAEAFAKTLAMGAGGTIEQLTRQNARLSSMVESMLEKHLEHITLTEELMSNKHARELESAAQASSNAQKEEIAKEVAGLIPAVIGRLTGVTPVGSLPPEARALRRLAENLTSTELDGLQQVLKPEHAAAVMEILRSVTESEVADQEARSKNGTGAQ